MISVDRFLYDTRVQQSEDGVKYETLCIASEEEVSRETTFAIYGKVKAEDSQ